MARSVGLILANRAVVLGAVKVADLVDLTAQAERSGFFDAVWAGDSLLAKPRLESVTLLPALAGVTLEPRPVQQPCPIWIASNPTGLTWKGGASASEAVIERSFRRIARHADGWMTNKLSPNEFRQQWSRIGAMAREEGRDPAKLGSALYHNINITEDRQKGLEETKAFLDTYYTAKFSREFVEQWTIPGGPKQCAEELAAYFDAGVSHMALRFGSWDQVGQFKRFLGEVAPALGA